MNETQRESLRRIARFRDTINRRAAAECDDITRSVEQLRAAEIDAYKSETQRKSQERIVTETQRIEQECNRAVASHRRELKQAYFETREQLRRDLFAQVQTRLSEFASSPDYPKWRDSKIKAALGNDASNADIVSSPNGGFTAKLGDRYYDYDFASLLNAQTEWFLSIMQNA